MRYPTRIFVPAVLAFALVACEENPTAVPEQAIAPPAFGLIDGDKEGAIVLNKGEAGEPVAGFCSFNGFLTNDVTLVRNPEGGGLLSCHWEEFGLPFAIEDALVFKNFNCSLNFGGFSTTTKSHFVVTPSDKANMHCTFDEVL